MCDNCQPMYATLGKYQVDIDFAASKMVLDILFDGTLDDELE